MRNPNAKATPIHVVGVWIAILPLLAPGIVLGTDMPISSLVPMVQEVRRDFASIHQYRVVQLTSSYDGPSDVIVSGKRFKDHGWHVEVFRKDRGHLIPKWDSEQSATGVEFTEVQTPKIRMWNYGHDYGVLIEGCASHNCADGPRGYLWFSGDTGLVGTARVTAQGLDKPVADRQTYQVEFSPSIDEESSHALQEAICSDRAIGNKLGLPFTCTAHWRQRGSP